MAGEENFEIIPHFVQYFFRLSMIPREIFVGSLYDHSLRNLFSFTNSHVHTLQHAGMNDFKHNSLYSDSEAERPELVDRKFFLLGVHAPPRTLKKYHNTFTQSSQASKDFFKPATETCILTYSGPKRTLFPCR